MEKTVEKCKEAPAPADTRKGMLLITMAGVCWATTGIFGTLLFREGLDPVGVASTRTVAASVLFFLLLMLPRLHLLRITGKQFVKLALGGLVSIAIFNVFYMTAIDMLGVSTAVVLLFTAPVFAVLLSRLFLAESVTSEKLVSLLLTFGGVVMVSEAFHWPSLVEHAAGIFAGLGAGLSFAFLSVFGKHLLGETPQLTANFYLLFLGAILLAMVYPPWEIIQKNPDTTIWITFAAMVLISTFLSHYCYVTGLGYMEAGRASITVAVEPVAAILMSFLFLGERLVAVQYVGIVLVFTGVMLLRLRHSNRI